MRSLTGSGAVPLLWYDLKLDDFDYLVQVRTPARSGVSFFTPHYGHIVPLFRLQTHALGKIAGSLEALPGVLGWACFGTLVLAILLLGASGRPSVGPAGSWACRDGGGRFHECSGLGGDLVFGIARPSHAGTVILAMLAALQLWRRTADFGRWSWACWR